MPHLGIKRSARSGIQGYVGTRRKSRPAPFRPRGSDARHDPDGPRAPRPPGLGLRAPRGLAPFRGDTSRFACRSAGLAAPRTPLLQSQTKLVPAARDTCSTWSPGLPAQPGPAARRRQSGRPRAERV
ncbi:jg17004 [Pararge aegeria aegeria]|uniref:Jg17004 protein n=1 Tax=Pararge aegeria aegeria TaxID=348720 RepID=A0A8S4R6E4_9NEOP|nr:jg17004 [Pararge aegeria aegeria]